MFAGVTALVDVLELLHQRLVDREAAGGVEDDDVAALVARGVVAASRQIVTGSLPSIENTGMSSWRPSVFSCSTAAGR